MIKSATGIFRTLRDHYQTRLWLLSTMVGVAAGIGALLFTYVVDWATGFFMTGIVGYRMPLPSAEGPTIMPGMPAHRWLLFLIPAVGGVLSGLTVYLLSPEAGGHGTDSVIDSFHRHGGVMRARVPFVKTLATAFTLGTGGSAGREGPITQVGAGFGSLLATWFKSSDRERRLLMLAGAGAGLGAIFRSPLGAALFATEVLYRDVDFEMAALVPSFVASIVAYSVYCSITGTWGALFSVPPVMFERALDLPLYIVLGALCAAGGIAYVKALQGVEDRLFHKMPLPVWLRPAIGGLVVGGIGFFLPEVLGQGYGWAQLGMAGSLTLGVVLAVAFFKIVATAFTIGSGGSGGNFAPCVVIGGMMGTALGMVLHLWLPNTAPSLPAMALVGMAGFLAGAAKTPLSGLIMVSEMTLGYGLLVPLMLTTATAYVLTPRRFSMYRSQVNARVDSPAHEGEFVNAALEHILVKEAIPADAKMTVFQRNTPLPEILDALASSKQKVFPVLDDEGGLHGVIDFDEIRIFFTERSMPSRVVVAQDLLAPAFAVVSLEEDLASVLRKFSTTLLEELPVVDTQGSSRVVGVLSRRNVIAAYLDRIA